MIYEDWERPRYESPYTAWPIYGWIDSINMTYRARGLNYMTVLWSSAQHPHAVKYDPDRVRVHVGREYFRPTSFNSFVSENNWHFGRR